MEFVYACLDSFRILFFSNVEETFWLLMLIFGVSMVISYLFCLIYKLFLVFFRSVEYKNNYELEDKKVVDYINSNKFKYGNYFNDAYNPY